ncbi:MAG: hypothetical protein NUV80_00585 [Candidatus Berkelbacteria bacterium]|nr:hypothetical protein [Candidatus Berkelbacteria bacterium]
MDGYKVRAIDSSTNATPIVVTDVAHGLATGDYVTIISHATNTSANGTWKITKVTADTFSLDGSVGVGTGGATGSWAQIKAPAIFVDDAESISVAIDTDGGGDAAFTIKAWASDQEVAPDAALAQSTTNQYDFVDMIDKEDGASIDGDTGFVVATADDHRHFDVNISHARWFGFIATAGTAGEATIKVRVYNVI